MADARLHSERAAKLIQEEVKRMEPNHAVSGALGGAAILIGGTVASAGLVVVLPAVAGYYKGLPAALSVLLGVSVTVVFVETGVALFSVSHILNGVLNSPKTAAMLAAGCVNPTPPMNTFVLAPAGTPGLSSFMTSA